MDCQEVEASSNIVAPPINIHIMVVDDDATSLALVSSLLKTLNYEVALFNDPVRALYTLRAGKQYFHLIMTALYMPKMDGFELTRRVNDEFKLPVIMISNDNRESVMYRAIQEGVVLYLLKPFSPNDLRNIWQFAITTKSRSIANPNLFMEETRGHGVEFRAVEAHSVSSSNEVSRGKKKGSKGKGRNQEKANDTKKKPKVVWTDFLQYRFLQAVHYIGLERAVPKKILEVMNVPGLTRENVASHLQKYRIFLRKVAERCMLTSDKTTEEIIWSKFLSRHASFMLEKIQQKRAFQFNSSQNPNIPPFSSPQSSNPNNRDRRRFTHGQMSFAMNLPPYGLGHTASFVNGVGPLPMNQHNPQAFNFSGAQFQNLALFEDPNYLHSSFSVGIGGEIPGAQKGVSNGFDGSCVGFDAMGVGNLGGYAEYSKAIQRDEFGQYGIGVGGNNNYNWGLMSNNGVNFGGDSQVTVRHSSQALDNKDGVQEDSGFFASLYPLGSFVDNPTPNQQQGNGGDQSHQLYNIYTADEESPTDPFSIDDQVLDEFMASLLRNDSSLEG